MLEAPRTPSRPLAARRSREVDVYGGPAEAAERPAPNIFVTLWRRRWIVLSCVVLSLIGGIIYYARATPIYASASSLYVQDNLMKLVNDNMSGGGRSQSFGFTQCSIITSSAILANALQKPGMGQVKMLQGTDNPVAVLKGVVTAVPDKFSDLIVVSCESGVPQDAATVANAIVESYIDYQGRQHKSTAVEVLGIFQKEVDKHEKNLAETQQKITALKKANPDLAFVSEKGSMVTSKLGDMSERLTQAQLRALDIRTAAAEAAAVKDDPVALRRLVEQFQLGKEEESTDPTTLNAYRAGKQRLIELLERLGSRHDAVKSAERQLARLQEEIHQATRDTAASYASLLQQSLRIAESRVNEYTGIMKAARDQAVELNFKQAEFEQLVSDKDRVTRSIDLLDARMKEINVNEDVGSLTVSVLEPAKPGFAPVRPLQSKVLGMALVAGLMGGVGLAMLRDLMDHRLRSADEITLLLELPILGVVPHIVGKDKSLIEGRLVELQPRSNVAEAYRTIRTAVSFSGGGEGIKTLLVTSPAPGDGKSTTASNLALAIAQSGRRTLLIDADCRRPSQDRVFELGDVQSGLSDVLAGTADLAAVIRRTTTEKLDLLPCGTIPHNPSELLDSQALLDLLGRVSADYDQVVIDSPPVVPVTDARILGASCDAVVLTLRADRSTRRLAEHARDALSSVGANMIGVIVNDVPRGKSGHGYDYYSYGTYGYKSVGRGLQAGVASTNGVNGDGAVAVQPRSLEV